MHAYEGLIARYREWLDLPAGPAIVVTAALFCFTLTWNEFLFALTFVTVDTERTVPVSISKRITPSEYTSVRALTSAPRSCATRCSTRFSS